MNNARPKKHLAKLDRLFLFSILACAVSAYLLHLGYKYLGFFPNLSLDRILYAWLPILNGLCIVAIALYSFYRYGRQSIIIDSATVKVGDKNSVFPIPVEKLNYVVLRKPFFKTLIVSDGVSNFNLSELIFPNFENIVEDLRNSRAAPDIREILIERECEEFVGKR